MNKHNNDWLIIGFAVLAFIFFSCMLIINDQLLEVRERNYALIDSIDDVYNKLEGCEKDIDFLNEINYALAKKMSVNGIDWEDVVFNSNTTNKAIEIYRDEWRY